MLSYYFYVVYIKICLVQKGWCPKIQTLNKYFLSFFNFPHVLKKFFSIYMHNLVVFHQLFSFFYVIFDSCFLIKYYSRILIMSDSFIIHCKENSNIFSYNDTFMETNGYLIDEKGRQPVQISKIAINLTAFFHILFININLQKVTLITLLRAALGRKKKKETRMVSIFRGDVNTESFLLLCNFNKLSGSVG